MRRINSLSMFQKGKFTEKDTEVFYDKEDKFYRSFWDNEGSLHWGYFDKKTGTGSDFMKASLRLTEIMAEKAKLNATSNVLDLGCGNGKVSIDLVKKYGCSVAGIDLSGARINNAKQTLRKQLEEIKKRILFKKASATDLPFSSNHFSHVWSQATIYHVHNKAKALKEIYRVLRRGGYFIFDDLLKPHKRISMNSRIYAYNRLLFDTDFNFKSYQTHLKKLGFKIIEAEDISRYLKRSYQGLLIILKNNIKITRYKKLINKYSELIKAYNFMVKAVDKKELGWGLFFAQKI